MLCTKNASNRLQKNYLFAESTVCWKWRNVLHYEKLRAAKGNDNRGGGGGLFTLQNARFCLLKYNYGILVQPQASHHMDYCSLHILMIFLLIPLQIYCWLKMGLITLFTSRPKCKTQLTTCKCADFDAENGTSFVKLKTKEPHTGQCLLASQCGFSGQCTFTEGA